LHAERQLADVLAVARQDVDGVELDCVPSCLRLCKPLKSETPSIPSSIASPSMPNEVVRFFSVASTISCVAAAIPQCA